MDREMNLHYKIHALVFHSSVRIACFVDFFLFNKVVGPSLSLNGLVSLHFSILVPHNIISCHQDTISLQMIIIFRGPKYGDFARISKHFKRNICGGGYIQLFSFTMLEMRRGKAVTGPLCSLMRAHTLSVFKLF